MILVLLRDDQFLSLVGGKRWVVLVEAIIFLNRNLRMKSLAFSLRGLQYWQMGPTFSRAVEISRGQIQST
jgi:hypothetical protein